MTWTLTNGETVFEISNGRDRTLRVADRARLSLQQQTDVATRARAAWPTAFPDRASSTFAFSIPVTFPPCGSLAAAMLESHQVPTQCPRGGVLTCEDESTVITYSQAWRTSIEVEPRGVSNQFTFNFQAINPDFTRTALGLLHMSEIANLNSSIFNVTGLTGGTSGKMDALGTTDVALGFKASLFFELSSGVWVEKMFMLVTRATAASVSGGSGSENTDPATGSLIIDPNDFNLSTNNKVWLEVN